MAKSKPIARPEVRQRRRSAADQEQVSRYLILGGVVAVILVAAGIIAFGWYQTQIKPLGKTVLQVGSMKYSLGDLEERMELMYEENQSYYTSGDRILALDDDAMDQLTLEAKVLQGAGQLDLSVSDEEFALEIKNRGNVSEEAAPDVYAAAYRDLWQASGLDEGDFNNMVKADLLQTKLSEYFLFVAPSSEAMVTANYAAYELQEEADELVSRVRAGEEFEAVGTDISPDSTGTLDWTPRGASFLPDEVQDYLFDDATPNEVGDPIEVNGIFYIAQLTERDPNRELDEDTRRLAGERDKAEWLDGLNITVVESLSEDDGLRAIEDVI